jgi:hypothetical protein
MTEWLDDLFPSNVTLHSPRLHFWRKRYAFLKHIDTSRVYLMLNWDAKVSNVVLGPMHRAIIFTSCAESPRYQEVRELAQRYPNVPILWLADLDPYDYPLPTNVTFVPYRHWYIRLEMFQECFQGTVTRVKDKAHKYKFSSLSYFRRPNRAVVTAALYTHARNSSLFTWRYLDNDQTGRQEEFIETFRKHKFFQDLDWGFFDQDWFIDQDNISKKLQADGVNFRVRDAMLDIRTPGFEQALINISNETDTFGWMDNGTERYNRPGPFLTEKTWKTLISGCALLNSGQPGTVKFLREAYNLPLDYSYNTSYDLEIKDFDRLAGLVETIQSIEQSSLKDLVDANIDTCQHIQDMVLSPEYLQSMRDYNLAQDKKIIELLAQWI